MKKHVLLTAILCLFMICLASSVQAKRFSCSMKAGMDSIKLSWKKQSGASSYVIYQADVTKAVENNQETFGKKIYHKLATVNGTKTSHVDQKVKASHIYAYYIDAYSKKKKLISSTYNKNVLPYQGVGLCRPYISNGGSGEFYTNTEKKFYIYSSYDNGVKPDYYLLYRKEANTDYKYIKKVKVDSNIGLTDTSMKLAHTYTYKVRTAKTYKKKTYYSPYSNILTLAAYTPKPSFTVTKIKASKQELSFKISSPSAKNGPLTFITNKNTDFENTYTYKGKKGTGSYHAYFTKYSLDGKTWKALPKKGKTLKAKQSLYLKVKVIPKKNSKLKQAYVKNATKAYLSMPDGCVKLVSPGVGFPEITINLKTGKAKARLYDEL